MWSMASVNKAIALLTGHALPFLGRVYTLGLLLENNKTDELKLHGWEL